jgi:hypothetical protein
MRATAVTVASFGTSPESQKRPEEHKRNKNDDNDDDDNDDDDNNIDSNNTILKLRQNYDYQATSLQIPSEVWTSSLACAVSPSPKPFFKNSICFLNRGIVNSRISNVLTVRKKV